MESGIVQKALHDDFGRLNVIWTKGFIEALTNLRPIFGNDMDKIVVLAVLGQTAQRFRPRHHTYATSLESEAPNLPSWASTNVLSISDSTGIPRESVRRKANELIEAGWVVRNDEGRLVVTNDAIVALKDTTERNFEIIDRTITALLHELEALGVIRILNNTASSESGPNPPKDHLGS